MSYKDIKGDEDFNPESLVLLEDDDDALAEGLDDLVEQVWVVVGEHGFGACLEHGVAPGHPGGKMDRLRGAWTHALN